MRLFEGTEFFQPQHCDRCKKPEEKCECPPLPVAKELIAPEKQTAKIGFEKRKKGKSVTVIRGLPAANNDLQELLTKLKNNCGAGGSIKDDELEIQGDHRERVGELLKQIGYRVKTQ